MLQKEPTTRIEDQLADIIDDNIDELTVRSMSVYGRMYPYSTSAGLPEDARRQWSAYDISAMSRCIRTGKPDPHGYENYGGDIVLQRDPLFNPIANYVEGRLFMAKVIASYVWQAKMSDHAQRSALLECLEASVQRDVECNMLAFLDEFTQPHTLTRTWRLKLPVATPLAYDAGTEGAPKMPLAQQPADAARAAAAAKATEAGSPLQQLTPRELEVFDLVVSGKQNGEIAAELHLQMSTVKNTVSRVFSKFGVNSRAELIIAAHHLQAQ